MYQAKLFAVLCALAMLIAAATAYPYRSNQFMEVKVKPKPIQVAVDNPDDVQEMVVKDITNQKRILIVAKNPAKFDSYEDRYEVNGKSNADAIRDYYENAGRQRHGYANPGYWQGSVLPASVN